MTIQDKQAKQKMSSLRFTEWASNVIITHVKKWEHPQYREVPLWPLPVTPLSLSPKVNLCHAFPGNLLLVFLDGFTIPVYISVKSSI